MTLLPDEIELRDAEKKATRGPWDTEINLDRLGHRVLVYGPPGSGAVLYGESRTTDWDEDDDDAYGIQYGPIAALDDGEYVRSKKATEDATFIVAARNMVPILLDRIATLRTAAEADRREMDALRAEVGIQAAMAECRRRTLASDPCVVFVNCWQWGKYLLRLMVREQRTYWAVQTEFTIGTWTERKWFEVEFLNLEKLKAWVVTHEEGRRLLAEYEEETDPAGGGEGRE